MEKEVISRELYGIKNYLTEKLKIAEWKFVVENYNENVLKLQQASLEEIASAIQKDFGTLVKHVKQQRR